MRRILAALVALQLTACGGSKGSNTAAAASSAPVPDQLGAAAEAVGKDPATVLTFVQGVRYELYPGVFRGSAGTLADGAGNDYDRAVLLHDLLTTAVPGIAVRYAFCTLSPQQADAAIAAARAAYVAPKVGQTPQNFWQAASAQERAQNAQLSTDFQKAGAQLSPQTSSDLRTIAADHVWVQVQQQGRWTDLDPSVPSAKPGAAICPSAKTAATLPDSAYDSIRASLWLETRNGTAQNQSRAGSQTWRTADFASRSLVFAFSEPLGLQSPAPEPSGLRSYTPVLIYGTQTAAASPLVVAVPTPGAGLKAVTGALSQAAAAFGGATPSPTPSPAPLPSGPIPVALRLDVTVVAPDESPVTVQRPIFDRVSAADRAAGRAATATLLPTALYPFGTVWSVAVNFGTGVAGGGNWNSIDPKSGDPMLAGDALGALQRAYYVTRRAVFADALGATAPAVIAAHPTITFAGLTPYSAGPVPYGLAIDRANEGAAPLGGDAAASLAWGVASVYGERLAVATPAMAKKSDALDQLPFDDVLEMFYLARNGNVAPAVVRSSADVDALVASADAKARLTASIAGGKSAVVPSKSVAYGGSDDFGWWTLGSDGSVSDEMQNGMHLEMAGEAAIDQNVAVESAISYRRSAYIVRCIAVVTLAMYGTVMPHPGGWNPKIRLIFETNDEQVMEEAADECAT